MGRGANLPANHAAEAFAPVLLVLIGSAGIQSSALISSTLFGQLGTVSVSTLRLALAAVLLFVIFRPDVRTMSRERWFNASVFGVAMAATNQFFYAAVERIPLGVAATLDFLGPCVVSFVGLKHARDRLWAVVAFAGVVLIAGPTSGADMLGVVFGALSGAFFALYTIFTERVGKTEGGMGDLAVSVAVAALVTLPLAASRMPHVDPRAWVVLAVAAMVGVVIPYVADTIAARISSAQVVGTLFALDPVVGSLLGWVFAGDTLPARTLAGIAMVTVAGAAVTWRAASRDSA